MSNEKLIEEARGRAGSDMGLSDQLLRELADALEAAEKAHTPTDDEREAQRIADLDARQAAYRKEREDWFVDHEAEPEIASNAFFRGWDAAVDGGFRRSEVPEPDSERRAAYRREHRAELMRQERAALRAAGEVRS